MYIQRRVLQEHSYCKAGRKFVLSPVSIITFQTKRTAMPLKRILTHHSCRDGLYTAGIPTEIIGNTGRADGTSLSSHITSARLIRRFTWRSLPSSRFLLAYDETGYTGTNQLSPRPTDKQIYDLENKQVLTEEMYDKDR